MGRAMSLIGLTAIIPVLFHACATAPKTGMRDDPLIGKIVDARSAGFISFSALVDNLMGPDVVYLSEKHDNPMHHAIQHRIIREMVTRGIAPVIGFEFFAMDDTPHLLNFVESGRVRHTRDQETFIEHHLRNNLGWEDQSDKMWAYYLDLLKLCRDSHLAVSGIDLSPALKKRITRKGLAGLSDIETQQLFSTHLENPAYQAYMEALFRQVHCGMGHGKMTQRLYDTWLARNDKMALSITQLCRHQKASGQKGPVVVIMGAGHTDYGLGVVDRVKALSGTLDQKILSIVEITREWSDLEDYLIPLELEGVDPVPQADFLWFTQRVSYQDPCEEFRKMFDRMKKHGGKKHKN